MLGKVAIIEFILMLAMAGAGVAYFRYTEAQIATLHENNAKLETAVNTQQETIKAQQVAAAEQAKQMVGLQQHIAEAENARRDFEDKLRQKDLSAMARANAADLEARMNRATQQVMQDIINLTTPKDRPVTPQQLPASTPTPAPATAAPAPAAAPAPPPAPRPRPAPPKTPDAPTAINPLPGQTQGSSTQPPPRPPKTYNQSGSN